MKVFMKKLFSLLLLVFFAPKMFCSAFYHNTSCKGRDHCATSVFKLRKAKEKRFGLQEEFSKVARATIFSKVRKDSGNSFLQDSNCFSLTDEENEVCDFLDSLLDLKLTEKCISSDWEKNFISDHIKRVFSSLVTTSSLYRQASLSSELMQKLDYLVNMYGIEKLMLYHMNDLCKHIPAQLLLFLLFSKQGTDDDIKKMQNIIYESSSRMFILLKAYPSKYRWFVEKIDSKSDAYFTSAIFWIFGLEALVFASNFSQGEIKKSGSFLAKLIAYKKFNMIACKNRSFNGESNINNDMAIIGLLKKINQLLDLDVNSPIYEQDTFFHLSVLLQEDNYLLIEQFLDENPSLDLNKVNTYRLTPLMLGLFSGKSIDFFDLLVKKGARINESARDKDTVLTLAAKLAQDLSDVEVFKKLLELGADASHCNNEGQSVYHIIQSRREESPHDIVPQMIEELLNEELLKKHFELASLT